MSKAKPTKKKVVVSTQKKPSPSQSTRARSRVATPQAELLFHRRHYILMGAGAVLIFLGLLLMVGGSMPSPDVWDDDIIYSFRRVTLAPIVILAGLILEIVAIFKK